MLIRSRSPGRDRASLIDATVISTGVGMLAWVFLASPYSADASLPLIERILSMLYVVLDVLVLALVIRLAIGGGDRSRAYLLMTTGWLVLVAADAGRALLVLLGTYDPSSPVEAGWLVAYALWGAAVLDPSVATLTDPVPAPHRADPGPAGLAGRGVADGPGHPGHPGAARPAPRHPGDRERLRPAVPAGAGQDGRPGPRERGHRTRAARRPGGPARAPGVPRQPHRPGQPGAVQRPGPARAGQGAPRRRRRGRALRRPGRLQGGQRQPRPRRRGPAAARGRGPAAQLPARARHRRPAGRRRVRHPGRGHGSRDGADARPAGPDTLGAPFPLVGGQVTIRASIGIAFDERQALDEAQLLRNADIAMYVAKSRGKGIY
jgi:hypothetical protein